MVIYTKIGIILTKIFLTRNELIDLKRCPEKYREILSGMLCLSKISQDGLCHKSFDEVILIMGLDKSEKERKIIKNYLTINNFITPFLSDDSLWTINIKDIFGAVFYEIIDVEKFIKNIHSFCCLCGRTIDKHSNGKNKKYCDDCKKEFSETRIYRLKTEKLEFLWKRL
jgi:hypothetical protein